MKVTRAQAAANRARIVEAAEELFKERGFEGVGVAELMAAAGLTHGGFYNHFRSKADLIAEATAQSRVPEAPVELTVFFTRYLSREHRDSRGQGCTLAALCGDTGRQAEPIKSTFDAQLQRLMAVLVPGAPAHLDQTRVLELLVQAIGAVVLSRACPDDSHLADDILNACRTRIFAALASPEVPLGRR